jgi:hypothetical protein
MNEQELREFERLTAWGTETRTRAEERMCRHYEWFPWVNYYLTIPFILGAAVGGFYWSRRFYK